MKLSLSFYVQERLTNWQNTAMCLVMKCHFYQEDWCTRIKEMGLGVLSCLIKSKKYLPYSREQKHVLLFKKSEISLFKVLITNMPHICFRNIFFVCHDRKLKLSASLWFKISWNLTKFQLIRTTFTQFRACY